MARLSVGQFRAPTIREAVEREHRNHAEDLPRGDPTEPFAWFNEWRVAHGHPPIVDLAGLSAAIGVAPGAAVRACKTSIGTSLAFELGQQSLPGEVTMLDIAFERMVRDGGRSGTYARPLGYQLPCATAIGPTTRRGSREHPVALRNRWFARQ